MSYYNRGGFRNNNNSYNNRDFGGSGNGFNGPRINETQVPQSKHTIFIRGLHGDITTEEIKEYIGEKVGRISFDFVKMSPDGNKIFVAVRFEKREEAKEFMETYSEREFMGCRCELSWFRDIRRYCAYQRAKQVRSNSQRRRRRSDSEGGSPQRSASPPPRRRSRSRSRSRSRGEDRGGSRSVSRSPSRRRTESRASRSRSRSSNRSESSRRSESRRSESRRSVSSEPLSRVSSRNQSRNEKKREDSVASKEEEESFQQIPLPPPAIQVKTSPKAAFIPPPSMDMELESPPQHVNPYAAYQKQEVVAYSMDQDDSPPKVIVREAPPYYPVQPYAPVAMPTPPAPASLPPPPPLSAPPPTPQPAFVPRQIGKIEILMPVSLPAAAAPVAQVTSPATTSQLPSSGSSGGTMQSLPTSNKLFGHLKAFQSALLSTVKYEIKEDPDDLSSLRLSSMRNDEDVEEQKALEREQKLSKLDDEQMMRFHLKKKQFETAFRNDCETFAVVTRALLAKDESLQFGLKMSLLENMEDLYKKMMQRVDDHLDAILS
uniref:RRM domain-containing protein n=1 Tax=Caenorhabditis tropicalis TaxID=1561998 RepID=A0A1I7V0S4_9PELO